MYKKLLAGILGAAVSVSVPAFADASLESALGLSVEQAATVSDIERRYRDEMRSIRGDLNRESRALRRARIAHDAELTARQESIVAGLEERMRRHILDEDAEIRAVLEADQLAAFERHLERRDAMVGSSRDVRVLGP